MLFLCSSVLFELGAHMLPSPVLLAAHKLQFFVFKAQVKSLYRQFVRAARQAPPSSRTDLREEIRRQFESHREASDLLAIKYHLSDGRQQLKQLQEMLGLQH